MAGLTTPITAIQNYVIKNQTLQLSNETPAGSWTSSDTGVATVGSSSGLVTGVSSGSVVITYTVGSDVAVFSLSVNPYNITNGLDLQRIINIAQDRLKWSSQGSSNSGRYYEDFHQLCDENLIRKLQPTSSPTSDQYAAILSSLSRSVILDAINSVFNRPQLIDKPSLVFDRTGYDRLYLQTVQNSGQFVGLTFGVAQGDFALSFKKLALFFDADATFTMYVYNDMNKPPISSFEVSVTANTQSVLDVEGSSLLDVLNYLSTLYLGGRLFIGYYQDDIAAQGCRAMFYNIAYHKFKVFQPMAFSAQVTGSVAGGDRNFNRTNIGANNLMYGFNAEVCSYIDMTNSIVQCLNSGLLDDLFGYVMAAKIIELIVFSYRNNGNQVNIMGNENLNILYTELNAAESKFGNTELNFTNGLRKKVEQAKRVVKKGFQDDKRTIALCG